MSGAATWRFGRSDLVGGFGHELEDVEWTIKISGGGVADGTQLDAPSAGARRSERAGGTGDRNPDGTVRADAMSGAATWRFGRSDLVGRFGHELEDVEWTIKS